MVLLESDSKLERDDAVPDFGLPGVDGETYSLSSFADYGTVLVVFICSHCPYAKAKFKELNHLASAYNDLAVIDINSNDIGDCPKDSLEWMQELAMDGMIGYTIYLCDEPQAVAADHGTICTPDPFLLENTGDGFELVFHSRTDDAMSPDDEVSDYEMWTAVKAPLAGNDIPIEECPSQDCSIKWKDEQHSALRNDSTGLRTTPLVAEEGVAGVLHRGFLLRRVGLDFRAGSGPPAAAGLALERGLFVQPQERLRIVRDVLVEFAQERLEVGEVAYPAEDVPHVVGALDARGEGDDVVAVVAGALDAIDVKLVGEERPERPLNPFLVFRLVAERSEVDIVKRNA